MNIFVYFPKEMVKYQSILLLNNPVMNLLQYTTASSAIECASKCNIALYENSRYNLKAQIELTLNLFIKVNFRPLR